jgi:cyclase
MSLLPRIIPVLLMNDYSLVKTTRFKDFHYIGDPVNTVRIFNELEVDEVLLLSIEKTRHQNDLDFSFLKEIATECFMPLGYGGGISSLKQAKQIFDIGFEKIVINTAALRNPFLIEEIANFAGSQSVVASIDTKLNKFRKRVVTNKLVKRISPSDPSFWAKEFESRGAGEILLTSIDREGTWNGLDLETISSISSEVSIPVIAHGGASNLEDINKAFRSGASAVGVGNMVVFQKQGMGVLINFPESSEILKIKNTTKDLS